MLAEESRSSAPCLRTVVSLFILLMLMSLSSAAYAQNQNQKILESENVRFGIKVGPSVSRISGLRIQGSGATFFTLETQSRTGLAIGAYAIFPVGSSLFFQPELTYIQKGTRFEFDGLSTGGATLSIAYLEAPLLLRFNIPLDQNTEDLQIQPYFVGGTSLGLKLHAGSKNRRNTVVQDEFNDITKAYEVGLIAGAGAEYKIDVSTATVDVRYSIGLSNISSVQGENLRNRGVVLTIGFLF